MVGWLAGWLAGWLSWVDDCLCCGKKESVEEVKEVFKKEFEVDDIRPLEEYVGCRIDYDQQQNLIQFPPEMVENWWRYGGELVTK